MLLQIECNKVSAACYNVMKRGLIVVAAN